MLRIGEIKHFPNLRNNKLIVIINEIIFKYLLNV